MKSIRRLPLWVAVGVGAVAVVAAGGGIALAATGALSASPVKTAAPSSLYGCVSGSNRELAGVYTVASNFKGCAKGFAVTVTSGGAGAKGATGPVGAIGPKGPAGTPGTPGKNGTDGTNGTNGTDGAGALPYSAEVDNGAEWTLSPVGHLADTSASNPAYADAGVVVDAGQASGLTTADFGGSSYDASGTLAENLWIADGPEATAPGTHLLSTPADFFYASYNADGTFTVLAPGSSGLSGTVTLSQIKAVYQTVDEAYVWAGLVSGGQDVQPVTVTSVDGTTVNAEIGIETVGSNALLSFVTPAS